MSSFSQGERDGTPDRKSGASQTSGQASQASGKAVGRKPLTGRLSAAGGARVQRKNGADPVDQVSELLSGAAADPGQAGASAVAGLARGGGTPLDAGIAARVEQATGTALGDVRVHTGTASVQAAADLGARAFTTGMDIHVGQGESPRDASLMAHEAAHTIQQRGGSGTAQAKGEVSQPGDALEREADAVAAAVVSGGTAAVSPGAADAIQRDVVSEVEERLSYGAFDWAITDGEAVEALNMLAGLGQRALASAMSRLSEEHRSRLLDNLPGSARQTSAYTRVLVAMGPTAVQPYVQSLLSYGIFDWAITDADAQSVFRILMALQGAQRAQLWTSLGQGFRARLVDNLQRAAAVGPDEQAGLKTIFDATPDAEVSTLCALMKLRFRVTFQATGDSDVTPMDWEAGGLRQMWTVLEALPPAHVEGNSALDFVERYAHGREGALAGGYYWSGRENVAMSYDPGALDKANRSAERNVLRDDGTRQDDPLYGVNRFDKVVRHEVGHAVDEENGHADAYCVGNEGGGDWAQLSTDGMAEVLVTASGGDISAWPDAGQKTAIIACLQGVVDERKPGELVTRIDALADLSAEQKTKIKNDKAVQVLASCFADLHDPWYDASTGGGIPLNGRIYQEAYVGDWWSYKQSTRTRKVSTYQFRAPGEWFAEAYAAYYTPSANKGDVLARVDPATKAWFDANVDPDGGRPNGSGPPEMIGDFPTGTGGSTGGDGTALA